MQLRSWQKWPLKLENVSPTPGTRLTSINRYTRLLPFIGPLTFIFLSLAFGPVILRHFSLFLQDRFQVFTNHPYGARTSPGQQGTNTSLGLTTTKICPVSSLAPPASLKQTHKKPPLPPFHKQKIWTSSEPDFL